MTLYETDPAYPTMSAQAKALMPPNIQFSIGHFLEKGSPSRKEHPGERHLEIHLHLHDGAGTLFSMSVDEPLPASLWNAGGSQTVDASFIEKMLRRHLTIRVSVDEHGECLQFEMLWCEKVPLGTLLMHQHHLLHQAMSA